MSKQTVFFWCAGLVSTLIEFLFFSLGLFDVICVH